MANELKVEQVEREDRIAADALFAAAPAFPLTAKLHAIVSSAFSAHRIASEKPRTPVSVGALDRSEKKLTKQAKDDIEGDPMTPSCGALAAYKAGLRDMKEVASAVILQLEAEKRLLEQRISVMEGGPE